MAIMEAPMRNTMESGTEQLNLSMGLDYYKPTMSQLIYEKEPDAVATFTFHNRGTQRLADYLEIDELKERFTELRERGFSSEEIAYLASLTNSSGEKVFTKDYLSYLAGQALPEVKVSLDSNTKDIAIETTGPWSLATFWETVVMSQVNESYFKNYLDKNRLDPEAVYAEGDRRLSEKIVVLQDNPGIKFADFGTRRRFSLGWQKHVLDRLVRECPANFTGTSNVEFSKQLGTNPVGTFAHELPMGYAGLAYARGLDVRSSHGRLLNDWRERYGIDLAIALTDTYGSDFFFEDFTKAQAEAYKGLRHDSGDPFKFGEKAIAFYEDKDIDPKTKLIVFSDALNIERIKKLYERFNSRINVPNGWGTDLFNDLGIKALNIVMKETAIFDRVKKVGAYTVKLSDDRGKNTGPSALVEQYQRIFGS